MNPFLPQLLTYVLLMLYGEAFCVTITAVCLSQGGVYLLIRGRLIS